MKNRAHLASLLIGVLVLAASVPAAAKPRIAVIDFDNKAAWGGWQAGRGAAEMMVDGLVKSNAFDVYERDRLDAIMQEQGLARSGAVTPESAAKIGKLAGVQYIVIGAVTKFGERQQGGGGWALGVRRNTWSGEVTARLIDVNTGRIVFSDNAKGESSRVNVRVHGYGGGTDWDEEIGQEVLGTAINELAQKIAGAASGLPAGGGGSAKASWSGGKVSKVDGDKIYLNGGSNDGVSVGDTFTVYQLGEEVVDPDTGEKLGAEEEQIGKIEVTEVKAKFSIARSVSGSGFATGNAVRR